MIDPHALAVNCTVAGEMLGGISEKTVRRMVARGQLGRVPYTDRIVIAKAEIERVVALGVISNTNQPKGETP